MKPLLIRWAGICCVVGSLMFGYAMHRGGQVFQGQDWWPPVLGAWMGSVLLIRGGVGMTVHPPEKFAEDILPTRFGQLPGRGVALARLGSRVQLSEKVAHAQLGHARGLPGIGLELIEVGHLHSVPQKPHFVECLARSPAAIPYKRWEKAGGLSR